MIASGDEDGEFIAWHGETGESLTKPIKTGSKEIYSVDFSPDDTVFKLATVGSGDVMPTKVDDMVKFYCTRTWQMQGEPINCGASGGINCIRYSPSGELLAIATYQNIQIYNPGTRERVASFTTHTTSLAWTPDGTRLLSGGGYDIQEWDPLTWKQVGHPWKGHTWGIYAIAINPAGTLVASAHLRTSMSVSGGSQIGKISASSSTRHRYVLSRSQWTAGTSSAEVMTTRSQSGRYQRMLIQRRVLTRITQFEHPLCRSWLPR
jgi:WD40 repeat protein